MDGRKRTADDGRWGWAFVLYVVVLLVLGLFTVGRIGVTWDEPNYFGSSYSYLKWFAHVAAEPSDWWASIDRYWRPSHEAPPFFKLWAALFAGVGALVFGPDDLANIGNAYRMGSYALFLLAVVMAFRFARREFGRAAAWGVAVSLPLMPVLFGFARLGQLDGAVSSLYLITALALHDMLLRGGGRRSVVWAGVLLGLAFATKLNVFPLVPAALVFVAIYRPQRETFTRLLTSFGVGAAVFFALWPWLWRNPIDRTWEFLTWAGGLQDERFTYYLGSLWAGAPWHYPLVMLVAIVPLAVAVAGVVGTMKLFRDARNPASAWILINLALVVGVAGSGMVPIYGGPRQFLAAFPLWAVCAGVGFGWLVSRTRLKVPVALAVYAALSLPGILWTGPANSLEYYGEAVGLIPGANALGFETTYLANTYRPAVEWLNQNAKEGATIYAQAGTYAALETYRRTGAMREDLRPAYLAPVAPEKFTTDDAPREGSFFLFLPRQSIHTDGLIELGKKQPHYAYEKGGVPLIKVYDGEIAATTLNIKGHPKPREVGLGNALVAGGGMLLVIVGVTLARRRG
ncbi:MAG: glycosyltransferase family 39 protein [Rubrobacteraceae bacterium]